jgi:hypothetical protein
MIAAHWLFSSKFEDWSVWKSVRLSLNPRRVRRVLPVGGGLSGVHEQPHAVCILGEGATDQFKSCNVKGRARIVNSAVENPNHHSSKNCSKTLSDAGDIVGRECKMPKLGYQPHLGPARPYFWTPRRQPS